MKKLLSITLAVAMLMSLFCVVPASADAGDGSYYFYTFEDGNYKLSSSTYHQATVVEGGVNGSAYATQIDVTNGSYDSGISGATTIEAETGDVLRASMWMKLPAAQHEDSKATVSLTLFGNKDFGDGSTASKIDGSTYKFVTATFDKNSTDWQKVTWEYTFKEDHVADETGTFKIHLRMNPNGGGNKAVDNTDPENPTSTINCSYLVDDLEIKIGKEYEPETVYDFESLSIGGSPSGSVLNVGGGTATKSVQADPVDSTNKAYKMVFKDRYSKPDSAKPWLFGTNYVTSHWYDENRTVVTGDKLTASVDFYVDSTYFDKAGMMLSVKLYARNASNTSNFTSASYYESFIDMTKLDQWQTLTFDLGTVTADETFKDYYLYIRDDAIAKEGNTIYQEGSVTTSDNGTPDDTSDDTVKAYQTYALSETVMYMDNLKLNIESISDATPTVTGASATMAADTGIVTPAYTYTTAGATTSADTSYFKLLDGNKVIASFAKNDVIVVPEANRTSQNLKLTIVPYSAGDYFGEEVTTAIAAAASIVGTTLTATAADGATVVSADAIENATLIWVAYDANGKMLSHATAACNVAAGGTATVAVPQTFNAAGAAEVKVMLWQDMVKCVPLADLAKY